MKRQAQRLLLACLFAAAMAGSAQAAPLFAYPQTSVGVLFLGDPSFRSAEFYAIVEEKLGDRFPLLFVGEEIQARRRQYYLNEKGLLKEEQFPTRQELLVFLKTLPYDQALVLVMAGPTIDNRYTFLWYFTLGQAQAYIQARALLVETQSGKILSDQEVVQKGPLSMNGGMSAKRGCFRKVLEYFAEKL